MADRKANPVVMSLRKELELSEKRIFLQRQQLRKVEIDDERLALDEAMRVTSEQISILEAELAEPRKRQ